MSSVHVCPACRQALPPEELRVGDRVRFKDGALPTHTYIIRGFSDDRRRIHLDYSTGGLAAINAYTHQYERVPEPPKENDTSH